jgi:hypothetical protein
LLIIRQKRADAEEWHQKQRHEDRLEPDGWVPSKVGEPLKKGLFEECVPG